MHICILFYLKNTAIKFMPSWVFVR